MTTPQPSEGKPLYRLQMVGERTRWIHVPSPAHEVALTHWWPGFYFFLAEVGVYTHVIERTSGTSIGYGKTNAAAHCAAYDAAKRTSVEDLKRLIDLRIAEHGRAPGW